MGQLVFVRHGQTDGPWDDRDRLSELGRRQARALGTSLAAGRPVDLVFTGPRRRHQETTGAVANAFAEAGRPFPPVVELPELDEYPAEALFRELLPVVAEQDEGTRLLLEGGITHRSVYRLLHRIGTLWARGELAHPEVEPWSGFCALVERGIARMTTAASKGANVVAFTSAGPVAAAVGSAVGGAGEKLFELSLLVRHASVTELLFSGSRLSLHSFNGLAHLADPAWHTLRQE